MYVARAEGNIHSATHQQLLQLPVQLPRHALPPVCASVHVLCRHHDIYALVVRCCGDLREELSLVRQANQEGGLMALYCRHLLQSQQHLVIVPASSSQAPSFRVKAQARHQQHVQTRIRLQHILSRGSIRIVGAWFHDPKRGDWGQG
eukprot:CAMPEP_0202922252 /NCGR_PEP_ID=MMETSP1392-20130828/77826_1 /ASSEMBLY_ACC=CAM_ASM_000868 /TAXON_ID=225041 /ORGANISM="Chlamydomonas chlamydogama, Strain SAG 11-48b" /LENGTH=146 /DNA_ID=CAMNT_0049615871 /DNA_START=584 /DNA_END=1024 /DNA_ORIENTATION=-